MWQGILLLPFLTVLGHRLQLHVLVDALAGLVHEEDEADERDRPPEGPQVPHLSLLHHMSDRAVEDHTPHMSCIFLCLPLTGILCRRV